MNRVLEQRRPNRCVHQSRGTVLIIVLWIALGVVSIALLFGHSMMLEYRAADNALAGREAAQAIEGAYRYVSFILANLEESGTLPDIEEYEYEQVAVGDATFWLLGRGDDQEIDTTPTYGLVDEASKLNLNVATVEMLEALPGMTAELAAAIIDWRDEDSEVSPEGAESEAYLLRDPKYNCKDSEFETIEELRLLIGGEWEILYNEDLNRNGLLDRNENDGAESPPGDDRDGTLDPGILEYVTVYSREPNDRTNINGDDGQELAQLLEETFGEERAAQIQQGGDGGGQGEYESVLEFLTSSGLTLEESAQISDQLTVSDEEYIPGLINVNTASRAVLACVPGIGEEHADELVAYRLGNSENLDSVAWVAEVLDSDGVAQAGSYITTNSYQFTADVAAVGHEGKGFRRTAFVFDTSGDEPIVVFRRDLSRLGWAIGPDARENLLAAREKRF